MDIIVKIIDSSVNTGPAFNLYSNVNNYVAPFVTNVSKSSLLSGYYTNLAPVGTTTVRIKSVGITCNNYIDVLVLPPTTTTTTTFPVTVDFSLEEINSFPYANPGMRTDNYTGGSGRYQITFQPFATEELARNPGNYSINDYMYYTYLASDNQPPTNIGYPPGTYWFGVRDTENPRNKRVKSIVISPLPVTKPFTVHNGTAGNSQIACSSPNIYDYNLRFTGAGDYPTVGDRLYTSLETPYILGGAWIKASNGHALQGNSSGYVISDIDCNPTTTSSTSSTSSTTTTTTTVFVPNVDFTLTSFCDPGNVPVVRAFPLSGGSGFYYLGNQSYATQQEALDGSYDTVVKIMGGQRYYYSVPTGTRWFAIKDVYNPANKIAKSVVVPDLPCPYPDTTTTSTTTLNPNIHNTLYMGFPTPNTAWLSFDLLPE